mgnify:CR=1 FL=1
MPTSSINLSDQPGLSTLAKLVAAMHQASPDVRPLLVGAMARDLLLSFAHGIRIARATQDMDFAFALDSWEGFARMRGELLVSGDFADDPRGVAHRLIFAQNYRVDLIPFGGMEQEDRTIAWPPDHDVVMQVVGFREAMTKAVQIQLQDDVIVDVASLPAQAVLKLFAWRDRRAGRVGVDAGDLRLLLRHYLDAGNQERLYTDADHLLTMENYDYHRASAWLIGHDARQLLHEADDSGAMAIGALLQMFENEIDPDGQLTLVVDMRSGDADADLALLTAFEAGLRDAALP